MLLATVTVDSITDAINGDTSSIVALTATPGADGVISLREAITAANNTANIGGPDEIHFDIPGTGVHTITPAAALPTVTDPVVIDGYSQTGAVMNSDPDGFNGTLLIELKGTSAGGSGLRIGGGGSTVQGLVINRFGDGIILVTNGGNTIQGNFIGTDPAGTTARANTLTGLWIDGAPNNVIGGTTAGARNVISASGLSGIAIGGSTATNNRVEGNFIGTDATGTADFGNSLLGVFIGPTSGTTGVPSNNTIGGTTAGARNVISGNNSGGVQIDADSNTVQGNYIGLDVTGTNDLGNINRGVRISGANNVIGGTSSGARNIISGNDSSGVRITGSSATGNLVQGNYIGTDVSGTADLGNSADGVLINNGTSSNTIGGTTAGAGNVIVGNDENGVKIEGASSQGNLVHGNLIGTNPGAPGLMIGNTGHGVLAIGSGPNEIGGTVAGAGNTIAHNGGDGVAIVATPAPSFFKFIRQNSIHSNAGLGIDLGDDGVTLNDLGDTDTGANELYNFPILESAAISGGNLTLTGFARPARMSRTRWPGSQTLPAFFMRNPTHSPAGLECQRTVGRSNAEVAAQRRGSRSATAQLATATARIGGWLIFWLDNYFRRTIFSAGSRSLFLISGGRNMSIYLWLRAATRTASGDASRLAARLTALALEVC